jgi:alkanesulfonate monooxygenase SsuD/methylene tetrahydromethanopterin reductase-like flavin-dependent oxidoreductase (luciferase family)
MDAVGFDCALVGERHQRAGGYAEPLTTIAWLLARTERLRVGAGGFILPIHHPYRLAEHAASLDVLSSGRFLCGVVLGYFDGDFAPFGVARRERATRMVEALELMRQLWRAEPVRYRGRHYALDEVRLSPRPLTPGGPPVWVGAKVDAAIRRAARLGDGWFASANDDIEALARQIALYRETRASAGADRGTVAVMRDGFIADSMAEVRAVVERPLLAKYREYEAWKGASPDRDRYAVSFEAALPRLVVGSPAECVDRAARYAELGVDVLVLRVQYPGLAHTDALRAIERFGAKVLPYFS